VKHPQLRTLIIAASILAISALHYLTPLHLHYLHDIYQRFYYIPIILAALWFGLRGGLTSAIMVSIVYAPHIMFQWGGHVTMEMEKYLEIVLYNIVGALTGLLSQREQEKSEALKLSIVEQEEAYRKLQTQTEKLISIEEELRRSEKLATLGEMAAVLAHEIRNPLGSIRGTAEILKDDYPVNSDKHEFIEIQIKETERLNNVVEDFLRMAKQNHPEIKPCPIAVELDTIVTILKKDAAIADVVITIDNISPALLIKGDAEKLRQALLNVMINAIHAATGGGLIEISAAEQGEYCELYIRDNGKGMTTETINNIFEPFFTTKESGTGLGLAITRKIIAAHGGDISVASSPGEGSCFTIKLPLWQ
jgi:signal transduction histidine kinase